MGNGWRGGGGGAGCGSMIFFSHMTSWCASLLIVIRIISIQWAGWHGRDSAVTLTVKMIPTTVSGILL